MLGRAGMLALFSLLAAPAFAQVRVAIGPLVGATVGGTTEEHRAVYGGRVAVDVTDAVSLELAVMHLSDEPTENRLGVTVSGDVGITPIQLSARYAHPLFGERLRGFVLGGVGYYVNGNADVDVDGLRPGGPIVETGNPQVGRDDAFGWQVGAGLEWSITPHLVVALEYRYALVNNSAKLTGLSSDTAEGQQAIRDFEHDFEDNDNLGVLDLGLSWRF